MHGVLALASLCHLVGDIHQLLHTAQLFTLEYTNGARGGNKNLRAGEASRATDGPTPVLGWRDYF